MEFSAVGRYSKRKEIGRQIFRLSDIMLPLFRLIAREGVIQRDDKIESLHER